MATMTLASSIPRLFQRPLQHLNVDRLPKDAKPGSLVLRIGCSGNKFTSSSSSKAGVGSLLKPISAVGSGLETSLTDPKDNVISVKTFEIVVESKDDDKMQVRVDLSGKETQIVFEKVLRNLAKTAPPVPGFRREKGGKTSKVPRDFLLQILGEDRVTSFVIQEIVSSTLADYASKENLNVKDKKINTTQTAEELKSAFIPGNDFGFNATFELEKPTEDEAEEPTEDEPQETTEDSS